MATQKKQLQHRLMFLNTEQDNDSYNDFLSFSKTLDLMRNEKLDDVCPWLQL